jgi:aspartyl-tRNA(Asn)/glutamyl-tRNA(Gln) amidotransferase subunit A
LSNFPRVSSQEIQSRIKRGEITTEEHIMSLFERIHKVENRINAFVTLVEDQAISKARELDRRISRGDSIGLLAGLAVAVKDNICTRGIPTTCSSRILESFISPYDATVIEKMEREDAIIIGKTNMDEFAMGTSTETSHFGVTHNPWDLFAVPGGSSGGSGAAVAMDETDLALGSDTGGSIRCPASYCSVVGLKPTYGLVSRYGLIAYANSLDQIGPITKNVYDCALLLSVIAGHDPRDSTSVEMSGYCVENLGIEIENLRVGVVKEYLAEGTEKVVKKSIWRAIDRLDELGASHEEVSLPNLIHSLPAYYLIAFSEASSNLARYDGVRYGYRTDVDKMNWSSNYSINRKEGFGEEVRRRIILGTYALSAGYYDKYYMKALKVRTLIKRDFDNAFKRFDVLVGPTMPIMPFKIGEKIQNPLALYMCDIDTVSANLAGLPAISIPCDFSNSLPIGLQIIAPPFREDLILQVASAFEQSLPFKDRRPSLE